MLIASARFETGLWMSCRMKGLAGEQATSTRPSDRDAAQCRSADDRERESAHQDEVRGPSHIQVEPASRHAETALQRNIDVLLLRTHVAQNSPRAVSGERARLKEGK